MHKADIDLDQIKLSGFFKYSAKRVQDFFDAESFCWPTGSKNIKIGFSNMDKPLQCPDKSDGAI